MKASRILSLVVVLMALGAAVGCSRLFGSSLGPSDAVTYQVVGSGVVGQVTITMATPTGVTITTSTLAAPFVSPVIAGYSQFTDASPSVTVLGFGCFDAAVLKNAAVIAQQHACGQPITVTAK